jgi:1-acyl-sn-glycerol-3-phosphate acyltransferase
MRTALALITLLVVTPFNASVSVLAGVFGVKDREGGVYRWATRTWGAAMCWAAGTRIHTHNMEKLRDGKPRVLIANHVSWFDVFALAAALPQAAFVSKVELRRIPLFGRSMSAAGHVFVDRKNRKAAFAAYEDAVLRIRAGTTVVIFPEGTRGSDYTLRPFKKGPFVLAVAAGVPVTPILVQGTIEVMRRGSLRVRRHDIHLRVLDDIATEGCTYEDRDTLADKAHAAMSAEQARWQNDSTTTLHHSNVRNSLDSRPRDHRLARESND